MIIPFAIPIMNAVVITMSFFLINTFADCDLQVIFVVVFIHFVNVT